MVPIVERRRRETINEGINELSKVVPGNDKNKGAILQSALNYIGELLSRERARETERMTIDSAIKVRARASVNVVQSLCFA